MIPLDGLDFLNLEPAEIQDPVVRQLLPQGEPVVGAFSNGFQGVVFTDKRMLLILTQRTPKGKNPEYVFLAFDKILAFCVNTPPTQAQNCRLVVLFPQLGTIRFWFDSQYQVYTLCQYF